MAVGTFRATKVCITMPSLRHTRNRWFGPQRKPMSRTLVHASTVYDHATCPEDFSIPTRHSAMQVWRKGGEPSVRQVVMIGGM